MKTVAALSFRDNHSVSMDVENVHTIEMSPPLAVEDGAWACEMIIRTNNGFVAIQLLADSPDAFDVIHPLPQDGS